MSISVDVQYLRSMSVVTYDVIEFFTIQATDADGSRVVMYIANTDLLDRIRPHVEAINDVLNGRDALDDLATLADAPSIATVPQPEPVDDLDDGNIF